MRILERDGQSSSPSFRIFWNEIEHDFSAWRALLRQRHGCPRAARSPRIGRHGGRPSMEGAALPCSRPARCALRAICDALPRHRPAAWLSAPWISVRRRGFFGWMGAGAACKNRTTRRSSLQFWIDSLGRVEKSRWHGGGWVSTTGSSGFA